MISFGLTAMSGAGTLYQYGSCSRKQGSMKKNVFLARIDHSNRQQQNERIIRFAMMYEYELELGELRMYSGPNGKPYLCHAPYFNLSHSGVWITCVVDSNEIGIDIQKVRRVPERVMRRYFYSCPEQERDQTIEWTKLESFVKMTGDGLQPDHRTDYREAFFLHNFQVPQYVISVCFSDIKSYTGLSLHVIE